MIDVLVIMAMFQPQHWHLHFIPWQIGKLWDSKGNRKWKEPCIDDKGRVRNAFGTNVGGSCCPDPREPCMEGLTLCWQWSWDPGGRGRQRHTGNSNNPAPNNWMRLRQRQRMHWDGWNWTWDIEICFNVFPKYLVQCFIVFRLYSGSISCASNLSQFYV